MVEHNYTPVGFSGRSALTSRRALLPLLTALILFFIYAIHSHSDTVTSYASWAYTATGSGGRIDLHDERMAKLLKLEDLRVELEERFEHWENHDVRDRNIDRINALMECIAAGTCHKNQEKIVILASGHFGNALLGMVSGEDIWALALDRSITALGYTSLYAYAAMETLTLYSTIPEMIVHIIMEASDIEVCIQRDAQHMDDSLHEDNGGWQRGKIGCIKREGFEEGIPVWMIHAFHGWPNPAHILGANFTVSIEPFRDMGIGSNYYIGYSIEDRCMAIEAPPHKSHQALVLGKDTHYFKSPEIAFPQMLAPAAATIGDGFEIVAVAGWKDEELEEKGLVNKGFMHMEDWYEEVAKSKMLIGIGNPPQSPSPYDALCLGVPFMNVINDWKKDDPENKAHWRLQQPALQDIEPPYVYSVQRGDEAGFRKALHAAVSNPIDRYVVPRMTNAAMNRRMQDFLDFDWKTEAERIVAEMTADEPFAYLL